MSSLNGLSSAICGRRCGERPPAAAIPLGRSLSDHPTDVAHSPNHGRDFVTLTVRLNSGLVGIDGRDQVPVDQVVNLKGVLTADNAGAANLP